MILETVTFVIGVTPNVQTLRFICDTHGSLLLTCQVGYIPALLLLTCLEFCYQRYC